MYACACLTCLFTISFVILLFNMLSNDYTVIQHGTKGLVILLSASTETVLSDTYYQSIGPYMDDYTVITYTLPYHDRDSPLNEWSNRDMTYIVEENNKMIDIISIDYLMRPLVLSGISRGGYLAAMYPKADYYFLFAPVMDWNQLTEWKDKNKAQSLPSFKNDSVYYVYSSRNDNRANGTFVIDYVEKHCFSCTLKIGESGHSVPEDIFEEAVYVVF